MHFAWVREVEKEVVLNEPAPPPGLASTEAQNVYEGAAKQATPTLADILSGVDGLKEGDEVKEEEGKAGPHVVKTIKKMEYELLCNQHNPVSAPLLYPTFLNLTSTRASATQAVAASKRASKLSRIQSSLLTLPPMARIKLRVSSGVFEVSLTKVDVEAGTVEVVWDDGKPRRFKWSSIVFIPGLQGTDGTNGEEVVGGGSGGGNGVPVVNKVREGEVVGQKPMEVAVEVLKDCESYSMVYLRFR